MSVQAMSWAMAQTTGSGTRKAVLLALANCHNHHSGRCFPSIARLAQETEFAERTVRAALTDLEEAGFLTRTQRRRKDGTLGVYDYHLPVAAAAEPPAGDAAGPPAGDAAQEPEVDLEPSVVEANASPTANGADSAKNEKPKTPLELLWDACELHVQPAPESESHRKAYAKLVREMFAAGWTPAMVRDRAKAYRKSSLTGEWSLTLAALAKWGIVVAAENEPLMERLKRQDAERRAREGFTAGG